MKIRTDAEGRIERTIIIGALNVIVDDKEGKPVAQFFGQDAFDNARRFINHCKFFVRGYSVFIAAFPKTLEQEDTRPQTCLECRFLDSCNQHESECQYPDRQQAIERKEL